MRQKQRHRQRHKRKTQTENENRRHNGTKQNIDTDGDLSPDLYSERKTDIATCTDHNIDIALGPDVHLNLTETDTETEADTNFDTETDIDTREANARTQK